MSFPELYCDCRQVENVGPMIACEECEEWYHMHCQGLTPQDCEGIDVWKCWHCVGGEKPMGISPPKSHAIPPIITHTPSSSSHSSRHPTPRSTANHKKKYRDDDDNDDDDLDDDDDNSEDGDFRDVEMSSQISSSSSPEWISEYKMQPKYLKHLEEQIKELNAKIIMEVDILLKKGGTPISLPNNNNNSKATASKVTKRKASPPPSPSLSRHSSPMHSSSSSSSSSSFPSSLSLSSSLAFHPSGSFCSICHTQSPRSPTLLCSGCNQHYHPKCVNITLTKAKKYYRFHCESCLSSPERAKTLRYCFCDRVDDGHPMIQCDECSDWCHQSCSEVKAEELAENVYICQRCSGNGTENSGRDSKRIKSHGKSYCYCHSPSISPDMIHCSSPSCSLSYYHIECLGQYYDEEMKGKMEDVDRSNFVCLPCEIIRTEETLEMTKKELKSAQTALMMVSSRRGGDNTSTVNNSIKGKNDGLMNGNGNGMYDDDDEDVHDNGESEYKSSPTPTPQSPSLASYKSHSPKSKGKSSKSTSSPRLTSSPTSSPSLPPPLHLPESNEFGVPIFCLCRQPDDHVRTMLECHRCREWYHHSCLGMTEGETVEGGFVCKKCK